MNPILYVDLRCLQDYRYRVRGIGQHVSALLRARRANSFFSSVKLVGLTDAREPKVPPESRVLVDEVSSSLNPCCGDRPAVFIDGTPMTHDTRFSVRFFSNRKFVNAAVVYDFIPLEWPGYLPTVAHRIDFTAKMARLRKFDLFFPISEYTGWRISELLGVSKGRIHVTGASVRASLFKIRDKVTVPPAGQEQREPYFVVVVASDVRKNPEVVIRALRRINQVSSRRIALKVVGHYEQDYRNRVLQLAGHAEGRGFLEFCHDVSDEELGQLYARAAATIVPSHIEGFSLPVVEAALFGCPVIASTCAAHLELVNEADALFPSYDEDALLERIEALLNRPQLRDSLATSQAQLTTKFHEDAVGARFWDGLAADLEKRQGVPFVQRRKKARLAFLSPFPPDQSGVARYTAMALRSGERIFDADLYTDAPRPLAVEGGFRDSGRVSAAPLIGGEYDGIVSVLGNSHFHSRIFDVFERYGGPCILHDARLIQIYVERLGHQGFLEFASRLLGRTLSMEEVHSWLHERNPFSLLLEPIAERAAPLMVHTVTQKAEIKRRYGVDAQVITSCPTVFFRPEELAPAARATLREGLGINADSFLISSFGVVGPEKGGDTIIVAVELLRSWNIPAELHFVGNANVHKKEMIRLAEFYGISGHVHVNDHFVSDATYHDFLIASDAAVQLRTYAFGQLSAALTDSISAGLPAVASDDLAKSCDAPDYVLTVPDQFSPLQVAEQLALIWEERLKRDQASHRSSRETYLATHNFDYYSKRLAEILEFA